MIVQHTSMAVVPYYAVSRELEKRLHSFCNMSVDFTMGTQKPNLGVEGII